MKNLKHGKKTFTSNLSERLHVGDWLIEGDRKLVTRTGTVELTIDIDKLIKTYGFRAMSRKSKRASAAFGAVVAKVHSITEAP